MNSIGRIGLDEKVRKIGLDQKGRMNRVGWTGLDEYGWIYMVGWIGLDEYMIRNSGHIGNKLKLISFIILYIIYKWEKMGRMKKG